MASSSTLTVWSGSTLFGIVAFELNALWVLLTRETPFRIWCAVEVTTATREKVHMRLIACEDYVPTTDETIEGLGNVWAAGQLNEVPALNVGLCDIQTAFTCFRSLPELDFPRRPSRPNS